MNLEQHHFKQPKDDVYFYFSLTADDKMKFFVLSNRSLFPQTVFVFFQTVFHLSRG